MKKFKNILIVAGGDGTRFWPLENKSYYSFLNKPLIGHLIDSVSAYADNLTVVVNKNDTNFYQKLQQNNIRFVIQDSKIPGMAGAIESCRSVIDGDILILNAEDTFDFSIISRYLPLIEEKKPQIVFLAKKSKDYFPGGYFRLSNNEVVEVIEKPNPADIPSDLVKLVADYFCDFKTLMSTLVHVKTEADDYYEHMISELLKQKVSNSYISYNDYWYVLKFPWHVLTMTQFFLKKIQKNTIDKTAKISSSAVITPPVYLGKNVKVGDFAKIVGPCFINDNTIIGDYTLVRGSHIGKNCLVGGYCEVTRSYLDDGIMLHRNYVGDSVLGKNVLMGSGAVTANFRFDATTIRSAITGKRVDTRLPKFGTIIGSGAKIGVNATVLPGVKVGRKTFVGPGEVVKQDVEDDVFLFDGKKQRKL